MKKLDFKLIFIIIISLIAVGNATYLTNLAYSLASAPLDYGEVLFGAGKIGDSVCDINSSLSCSGVFSNDFAWIFGIPFSLYAMFVYPIIIVIAALGLFKKNFNSYKIIIIISVLGLIFNGYIITNEYFAGVYCLLCMFCTGIIIINLIVSLFGFRKLKG